MQAKIQLIWADKNMQRLKPQMTNGKSRNDKA